MDPNSNNMNKCKACNKSLKLIDITLGKCKCKNVYCKKHKMPEDHKCSYNYKDHEREILGNKMKKVEVAKISHI